jgi:hypothetical protein
VSSFDPQSKIRPQTFPIVSSLMEDIVPGEYLVLCVVYLYESASHLCSSMNWNWNFILPSYVRTFKVLHKLNSGNYQRRLR